MASAPVLDLEALLTPIAGDAPAGEDLRTSASSPTLYYSLKDLRVAARAAERDPATTSMPKEWQEIATLAPKILVENSKDLEVVCWYIEALVRIHGFAGLRDGFALAQGLVERFWDSFISLPADDDGLVTRLMPITGLNGSGGAGTLLMPINNAPITGQNGDDGPFSYFNYEKASELSQRDAEFRAKRVAQGDTTLEVFTAAVTASGGQFYVDLIGDIEGALATFNGLTAQLDARAGAESPPSSSIQELLDTILRSVRAFSSSLVAAVAPPPSAEPAAIDDAPSSTGASLPAARVGAAQSREDALRTLLQLAEYFRTSEPQSPISTMLEETVRRARMSFSDLLAELLEDKAVWRSALTKAGINPPAQEG
jgi:type VI secretion system protein ImpA